MFSFSVGRGQATMRFLRLGIKANRGLQLLRGKLIVLAVAVQHAQLKVSIGQVLRKREGGNRRNQTLDTQIGVVYSRSSICRSSINMPKQKLDPLPSAAFQILLSLADQDLHGYGIMRQVEQETGGKRRLGPGTLYSSIQALLEERLIAEVERNDSTTDERRRYYRLTAAGRKLARGEAERLADLLRVARAKRILGGDYV